MKPRGHPHGANCACVCRPTYCASGLVALVLTPGEPPWSSGVAREFAKIISVDGFCAC